MLRALRYMLNRKGPEADVPLKWLMHRPRLVGRKFARRDKIEIIPDQEGLNIVRVAGKPYVWPQGASIDHLLVMLSEILLPEHPHQYLWGQTQIAAGDTVLDIGSCEGSFAALAVEKGANVIAVEPSPMMQRIIRRLFEVRELPPAHIAACALGTVSGMVNLVEESQFPGYARVNGFNAPSSTSIDVPIMTLDALVDQLQLTKLDFIKCDAEGLDVEILRSGEKTLRRFHPKVAICTYHEDDDYQDLWHYLKQFDYEIKGKGFLRTPSRFRPMMLHAW